MRGLLSLVSVEIPVHSIALPLQLIGNLLTLFLLFLFPGVVSVPRAGTALLRLDQSFCTVKGLVAAIQDAVLTRCLVSIASGLVAVWRLVAPTPALLSIAIRKVIVPRSSYNIILEREVSNQRLLVELSGEFRV